MRCSVGFGNAILLVAEFPVSPLTGLTAIYHDTTPGAGRKFRNIRRCAIAANIAVRVRGLLIFLS